MVITVPFQRRSTSGPRPINLNKDIPQVIDLLELVFGEKLQGDGQQIFSHTGLSQQAPFLWRLTPGMTRLSPGFIWEENGRIIGNATLLKTKSADRYLVVNVAVHPEYRRQGIARSLMESVINLVRHEGGRVITLQVVKDNTSAINLYTSLHFRRLGNVTNWYSSVSRVRALLPTTGLTPPPPTRELKRGEWRAAYHLDQLSLHPYLNWPEPLPYDAYKTGLWRRLSNLFNGRQMETWVIAQDKQLIGLASIIGEWGRLHNATVRIHPRWRGQLERALLAKLIRRLQYLPRRNIRIDHPDDDEHMNQLLHEANFKPRRTLTFMRLELDP